MGALVFWIGFHILVLGLVFLDLKVFHKNEKDRSLKNILWTSCFWVFLALVFNMFIWIYFDFETALTFFTAYLLEKSLSIDNLFLFLSVFSFCGIELRYQYRVLAFGVVGALVCRLVFILLGISLIQAFEWIYLLFGGFLCVSAFYLYREEEGERDLSRSFLVKMAKRFLRFDESPHQGRFFIRKNGKIYMTMLFLSLLLIEASDIIFAVDSVPAVLAITSNPFIAYTSNVFAVLGLRSVYFLLMHLKKYCTHLKSGIALILFFIGIKLILMPFFHISSLFTLGFILIVLICSFVFSRKD